MKSNDTTYIDKDILIEMSLIKSENEKVLVYKTLNPSEMAFFWKNHLNEYLSGNLNENQKEIIKELINK